MNLSKVHRVTGGGLIDEEQGSLRAGSSYVDQIFTLKQIDEKKRSVCEFSRS